MNVRRISVVAVFLLALSFRAGDVVACSCGLVSPPCDAAWRTDAIIAGIVRSVELIDL